MVCCCSRFSTQICECFSVPAAHGCIRATMLAELTKLNRAISGCRTEGDWLQALSLLENFERSQAEADVISYNSTISVLKAAAQWQKALLLLQGLELRSLLADVITLSTSIQCCEFASTWLHAVLLLEDHNRYKLEADLIAYNSILHVLERTGRWQQAFGVLQSLLQRRQQIDEACQQHEAFFRSKQCLGWEFKEHQPLCAGDPFRLGSGQVRLDVGL